MAAKFKIIFGDFLRSLHQLWLEVIGGLFLLIAVALGIAAMKEYQKFSDLPEANIWVFASTAGLSLATLLFGIQSFRKSRKLR